MWCGAPCSGTKLKSPKITLTETLTLTQPHNLTIPPPHHPNIPPPHHPTSPSSPHSRTTPLPYLPIFIHLPVTLPRHHLTTKISFQPTVLSYVDTHVASHCQGCQGGEGLLHAVPHQARRGNNFTAWAQGSPTTPPTAPPKDNWVMAGREHGTLEEGGSDGDVDGDGDVSCNAAMEVVLMSLDRELAKLEPANQADP